jgi:hypothetical protein
VQQKAQYGSPKDIFSILSKLFWVGFCAARNLTKGLIMDFNRQRCGTLFSSKGLTDREMEETLTAQPTLFSFKQQPLLGLFEAEFGGFGTFLDALCADSIIDYEARTAKLVCNSTLQCILDEIRG